MSSMRLVFGSDRPRSLTTLTVGERGVVVEVSRHETTRVDRLLALGVTPGAAVTMLQKLPGVVFLCDQTELAVERTVADAILVRREEHQP